MQRVWKYLEGGLERYKNKRYTSAGPVHTAILITRYKLSFIRVSRILLFHTIHFVVKYIYLQRAKFQSIKTVIYILLLFVFNIVRIL